MSELQKRVLSAMVLIPLVLGIIYIGGWIFTSFVILLAVLMLYEWFTITKEGSVWWKVLGLFYVGIACYMLWITRTDYNLGDYKTIYWFLLIIWATDTGAYFIGKKFGNKKLAPNISPNKTWAGFWGGIICSLILQVLFILFQMVVTNNEQQLYEMKVSIGVMFFLVPIISIISQMGDLFESWLKRKFDVKDSGNIIPGHGGVLDRLDGVLSVFFIQSISIIF